MNKVLSEHVEWLGKQVVDIAVQIHKTLGQADWKKFMRPVLADQTDGPYNVVLLGVLAPWWRKKY